MDMNEYQERCNDTAIYPRDYLHNPYNYAQGYDTGIMYNAFNLCSESGEIAGKIAKAIRKGESIDFYLPNIKDEIGDCLWNIAMLARELGYNLDDIAESNLNKLQGRKQRGTLDGSGDSR